jgi:hypothetical protein
MDESALAEKLGVKPFGVFRVKNVQFAGWGSDIIMDCEYEPDTPTEDVPFYIHLHDCREIHWRVYAHLKPPEDRTLPAASMVNLHLGKDNHRKPLHLLTDSFGISVSYGTMTIEKTTSPT